jgi:hypothetical protein
LVGFTLFLLQCCLRSVKGRLPACYLIGHQSGGPQRSQVLHPDGTDLPPLQGVENVFFLWGGQRGELSPFLPLLVNTLNFN